jgi:hypothetical protein
MHPDSAFQVTNVVLHDLRIIPDIQGHVKTRKCSAAFSAAPPQKTMKKFASVFPNGRFKP